MSMMNKGSKDSIKNAEGLKKHMKPLLLVLILALVGLYYEFIYKKEQSGQQVATVTQDKLSASKEKEKSPMEPAQPTDAASDELSYGFYFLNSKQLGAFTIFEKTVEDEFKKNNFPINVKLFDLRESADIAQASSLKFQLRDLASLLEKKESAEQFIPLEMSDKCVLKQSVFVKKESPTTSLQMLAGKKMIILEQRPANILAFNFLISNGLDSSPLFLTKFPKFAFKMLNRGKVEAIIVSYYEIVSKDKAYSLPVEFGEFGDFYRELEIVSPSMPCLTVVANSNLDRATINRFKSVYAAYPKNADSQKELGPDHFSALRESAEDELKKISESTNWEKVNSLKTSMKVLDPSTDDNEDAGL